MVVCQLLMLSSHLCWVSVADALESPGSVSVVDAVESPGSVSGADVESPGSVSADDVESPE